MKAIVFTLNSLRDLLNECPIVHSILAGRQPDVPDVISIQVHSVLYVLHREDSPEVRRIVVVLHDDNSRIWPKEANQAERQILERMYILGELAERRPLRLPAHWGQYKYDAFIAFYACGRELVANPLRWIAEVQQGAPHDVCYWQLTTGVRRERLEDFIPPETEYAGAISNWSSALAHASRTFHDVASSADFDTGLELSVPNFADVTQNRSRADWLSRLTPQQSAFITQSIDHSIKLRGPAGSGKTLTLELKALHEIDQARKRGDPLRVLFITHSWALAEEVDANINALSEWGSPEELTIVPLLAVANEVLPAHLRDPDRDLVGEDSVSGKTAELQRINTIVSDFLHGDWLTFRDEVSDPLRASLESADPADRSGFAWDCLVEFGCVLGADGIFPGVDAELKYLRLPRTSWMMPLKTDADKRMILHLYERYIFDLDEKSLQTSDQLVNDFLSYLETFAWNTRRVKAGYDLIFVDEFHLFNVQERHLLRYLARSRFEYPKIFMALDPKQSPWGIYSGLAEASPSSRSGRTEDGFGQVSSVDLGTVHRFSPEILGLVKHLDWEFPNLDLGADYNSEISTVVSTADSGPVPRLVRCGSQQAELIDLYESLRAVRTSGGGGGQIAVAIVDQTKFRIYENLMAPLLKNAGVKVSVISSREDVEIVQYTRHGIVLGPAEYLAGLQFDSVFIAGLPESGTGIANPGYRRMRFLSLLYLAITRARREVHIFANDDYGGIPEILQRAVERGHLSLKVGRTV